MVPNFVVKHSNNVKTDEGFFFKKEKHLLTLGQQLGQRCGSVGISEFLIFSLGPVINFIKRMKL